MKIEAESCNYKITVTERQLENLYLKNTTGRVTAQLEEAGAVGVVYSLVSPHITFEASEDRAGDVLALVKKLAK